MSLNMNQEIKTYTDHLRRAMLQGTAIDYPEAIWTKRNFDVLRQIINNNLKVGGNLNFDLKFKEQIKEAQTVDPNLTPEQIQVLVPLMAEVKSLYYVFLSNVKKNSKVGGIKSVLAISNELGGATRLTVDSFPVINAALSTNGIGSGGMGINTNKQKEIFYLIDVLAAWFGRDQAQREAMLSEAGRVDFQNFIDRVQGGWQSRHIVLHLLFPEYYESIISGKQKRRICRVFAGYMNDEMLEIEDQPKADENIDQRIKVISKKLAEIRGRDTHFYSKEIRSFWDMDREEGLVDVDTDLLEYKKQLVLYGPPGTGKTYTASKLAEQIIRYRLTLDMKTAVLGTEGQQKIEQSFKENIHLLQLHPAYSYEDFVCGLKIKKGDTVFVKGYLLKLLDSMKEDPSLPHVLILDEINRVDLSRLFGECFSALENRKKPIELLGANEEGSLSLTIPDNLYLIGTMNQIDHSIEQLDFALRRRFLWVEASYDGNALLSICEGKWPCDTSWPKKVFNWSMVEDDFSSLVEAADKLNAVIRDEDDLGNDFVLGHAFFLDVVVFLSQTLEFKSQKPKNGYLFTSNGQWHAPVNKLWNLSLYPLLREYLAGVDHKAQQTILKKLEAAFRPNNA